MLVEDHLACRYVQFMHVGVACDTGEATLLYVPYTHRALATHFDLLINSRAQSRIRAF